MISSNLVPLFRSFDKHSYKFAKHNKFLITNDFNLDNEKLEQLIKEAKNGEDFEDNDQVIGDVQTLVPYEHPREEYIVRNYFSESS